MFFFSFLPDPLPVPSQICALCVPPLLQVYLENVFPKEKITDLVKWPIEKLLTAWITAHTATIQQPVKVAALPNDLKVRPFQLLIPFPPLLSTSLPPLSDSPSSPGRPRIRHRPRRPHQVHRGLRVHVR